MKVLGEAIEQYQRKNYAHALELFERAAGLYGHELVKANIHLCKKRLNHISHDAAATTERAGDLDPATVIMLDNAKKISIKQSQRSRYLQQYKLNTKKKSEVAEIKPVNPIPGDWPKDLKLAPLPAGTNDYSWATRRRVEASVAARKPQPCLSVIIPTFNRSRILDITLACLLNQKTDYKFEIIVADDGSRESVGDVVRKYEDKLDIKYVRQRDYGYQLCAVRNLGLRVAKYDFVAILDCDMAPNKNWVQSYVSLLMENDDVALIGPRKYIDTSNSVAEDFSADDLLLEQFPEVVTNNDQAGKVENLVSIDWRLDHFSKTEDLRLCDTPFRFFSGGNVAFAKKWLDIAGWFDEDFTHWGGEDNEFAYRLYRHGCFFRAVEGGLAYHQEPPGKENETDRSEGKKITINLVKEKVPYFYRKLEPIESARIQSVPLVSIYIPAYNCSEHIVRCVDSALNQTVTDLEVCICDDGSTDNTLEVILKKYGHNPRVRVERKENGGIASASNHALRMARGYYIGQLDSDDYLESDAVELCLSEFFKDRRLVCVYTTNRNVNQAGELISLGYNWPEFSREKLTTAMIAHHFRMFTARAWNLTSGFDESIANAVDYDMYLKLSEVGCFKHINMVAYNRVLHGENTSIKKLGLQKENHFLVVNRSLQRQSLSGTTYIAQNPSDAACRKYSFGRAN
ncbi:glycosyltransferase [Cupriavidus sp. SS-3]|uniref:glycosyltransferase n=1 Tax=Cupriavidus sp. SS-3 TaxID=3109596 RepID=UPI002DB82A21|nr:glycosyltransferase [Cupriavidus sp. SS-3]MEC3766365.1 glycosyltransferase [Cupriavidus sp. SS-3]